MGEPTPGNVDVGGRRSHRIWWSFQTSTAPEELIPTIEDRPPLAELMAKPGDGDFLRSVAESVLQIIMEADVDGVIGAGRHERSGDRSMWRNGYRDRSLDTRLCTLNLKIPKLRTGAYFSGFLEPRKRSRRRSCRCPGSVDRRRQMRRVDELVQAMGMSGISKSSVSKLCTDIDERVTVFLAPARQRLAVSLARCHLSQGPRGPPLRQLSTAFIAVAVTTEVSARSSGCISARARPSCHR